MIHAVLGGANDWGFPVRETALVTYRSVFVENLRFLPRAVLGPLVMTLLVGYGLFLFDVYPNPAVLLGVAELAPRQAAQDVGLLLLAALLLYLPHALLAVAWIRLTLLGPRRAAPPLLPRPTWAHARFLGYLLLAGLGGFAVFACGVLLIVAIEIGLSLFGDIPPIAMLGTAIGIVGAAIVFVLSVGTFLRLALALPITLVAPNETVGELWRLSSGQNVRLLIAEIIISIPLALAGFLVYVLSGGSLEAVLAQGDGALPFELGHLGLLFLYLPGTLLALLWTAVNASFIAIAFQTILRWFPPDPMAPPGATAGTALPSHG